MSVQNVQTIPDVAERAAGLAHTDITNQITRALHGMSAAIVIGQVDEPPLGGGISNVLVMPTVAAAGGGKYTGFLWTPPTATIPAAGNLTAAEMGTLGDAIFIVNAQEQDQSTHDLIVFTPTLYLYPAFRLGNVMSDEATPKPVYVIHGFIWNDCS